MLNKNKKTASRLLCSIHRKLKDCPEIISLQCIPTKENLGGTDDLN